MYEALAIKFIFVNLTAAAQCVPGGTAQAVGMYASKVIKSSKTSCTGFVFESTLVLKKTNEIS